jgi:PKD repeat protein
VPGVNYLSTNGTLNYAYGELYKTFSVTILNDNAYDTQKYFYVNLSNPSGCVLGTNSSIIVYLNNITSAPTVQFNLSNYTFNEGDGSVTITVVKTGSTVMNASISYATANGTALSGKNYTAASGTLTFTPGESQRTFQVVLLDEGINESNTYFYVNLSTPVNATVGANASATINIVDNDLVVPPVANFTSNVTTGTVPLTVQFYDNSTNTPTAWQWNFGDSSPNSTEHNPVHTYDTPGTYNVTLMVTNSGGSDSTIRYDYILVKNQPPTANFTANVTEGAAPLTVLFTDTSSGVVDTWEWNFSDGTSNETTQNVVHTFNNPGTYTVTLKVTNNGGSNTMTKTSYITVKNQPPTANFTANVTSGTAPLTVKFYDNSTGVVTGWEWDFGDGTPNSTQQSPSHQYVNPGVYTVTLTVSNDGGSGTMQKVDYITVIIPAPVANFTANVTSGTRPLTVMFNDTSSGGAGASWDWSFGDGSPNETTRNVSHTYTNAGTYTVTLTVTNAGGSSTMQKVDYITVLPHSPDSQLHR